VRQVSGVSRNETTFELTSNTSRDAVSIHNITCVVLHHTTAQPCADQLIERYLRRGVAGLHERARDCAVVLYDANSGTLVLARDALGTTPLYFGGNAAGFAFGTRVVNVISALSLDVRPDRATLAASLVGAAAPAVERTCFTGISAVPPGATLARRAGTNTVLSATDQWPVSPPGSNYQETVEAFAAKFRAAVSCRLDDGRPVAVLTSGGLDSSAIICAAAQLGADVFGITYGPEDGSAADESHYVDALRGTGLRIKRVPFYPVNSLEGIAQSVREGETPFVDQVTLTLQRAAHAACDAGARTVLLGTWGDQVLAPFPPAHVTRIAPWCLRTHAALARAYQRYMSDVPMPEIRTAFLRHALRRTLPQRLLAARARRYRRRLEFDLLVHDFPAREPARGAAHYAGALEDVVSSANQLEAAAGTTKWGTAHGLDARLPFLDVDLLRFMHGVPDEFVYLGHALKPLLRGALADVLPAAVLNRRDKGDYTTAIRREGPRVADALEQMDGLHRLVQHGLLSRSAAQKTLARLTSASDIATSDEWLELLGLDAWLKLYF
jgi:asparagine synthase (glutamine-hydrolysing)